MASRTYAKSIVRKWYKDFPSSDLFQARPPAFQRNAKWMVKFFAELMVNYMDDPPSRGTERTWPRLSSIYPPEKHFRAGDLRGLLPHPADLLRVLGPWHDREGMIRRNCQCIGGKGDRTVKKREKRSLMKRMIWHPSKHYELLHRTLHLMTIPLKNWWRKTPLFLGDKLDFL